MERPPQEPDFSSAPQGDTIRITAADGHVLDAYLVVPAAPPRGGLVVIQEMYGLTRYITAVCDFFARHGYRVIAPALYDRLARDTVLEYTPAERDRAHVMFTTWNWDLALIDIAAARDEIAADGKVGVLGYCWGGSLAWLSACRGSFGRGSFDCAVAYYGSAMPDYADEQARCPVLANCGDKDTSMPIERIREFQARQPGIAVNVFQGAQHAFDNPLRGGGRFDQRASAAARAATLDFLSRHVG